MRSKGRICRYKGQAFNHSLGNEHAIKRVLVVRRQCGCQERMLDSDREHLQVEALTRSGDQRVERYGQSELAQCVFDADLPDAGHRDETFVTNIREGRSRGGH